MDTASGIRIDKLREDKFCTWKTHIQLDLSLKEVDRYICEDVPSISAENYADWRKGYLKAKSVIGLTLTDAHYEQVQLADYT